MVPVGTSNIQGFSTEAAPGIASPPPLSRGELPRKGLRFWCTTTSNILDVVKRFQLQASISWTEVAFSLSKAHHGVLDLRPTIRVDSGFDWIPAVCGAMGTSRSLVEMNGEARDRT